MNKNRLNSILTGVVVGLLLTLLTIALPRVQGEQLIRMGVVNWEQVVMQYDEFQKELKELQRRRMRVLNFIDGDSSGSGKKKQQDVDAEMEKIYQDTLKQIENRREKLRKKYQQKIYDAIRNESIKQGYSLVLSENEVLYASEEYTDLTHSVIERLNKSDDDQEEN